MGGCLKPSLVFSLAQAEQNDTNVDYSFSQSEQLVPDKSPPGHMVNICNNLYRVISSGASYSNFYMVFIAYIKKKCASRKSYKSHI